MASQAPADSSAEIVQRDSSRSHPNDVPYASERSVLEHVLAAPSYALHYATRPIGWAVVWAEEHIPELFEPDERPVYGAYPLLELGGPVGVSGGIVVYHDDLFARDHQARARALFGSRSYNDFGLSYRVPQAWGEATALEVHADYFNNPRQRFFQGGNEADRSDETRFAIEQGGAGVRFDYEPASRVTGRIELDVDRVTFRRTTERIAPDEVLPQDTPGLGTADRVTARTLVTLDTTPDERRPSTGARLQFGAHYTHEFGADRFRYGGYLVEWQQFVPVPLLPEYRRLALRARLGQVAALGGDTVPFYVLSELGGPETLRGFVSDRFSDNGLLLLTAEYRYPIWSSLDAVAFVDAGQVFDEITGIGLDRFHANVGGGIRFLSSQGLSFRFEIAHSREGTQTILTVRPLF